MSPDILSGSGLSDAELVRRITVNRDHEAFETLYVRHYRHLLKSLLIFIRNDADAEDAAQYAFVQIWKGTNLASDSAMPLLFTYARNYFIQRARIANRHPHKSLTPVGDERPLDFPEIRETAEPDFTPDMLAALPTALKQLDPRKAAFVQLHFSGQTCTEIAQQAGIHESTVSRHIASTIKTLRQLLGVPEPRRTNYEIHDQNSKAYHRRYAYVVRNRRTAQRAYAACAAADQAIGKVAITISESMKKRPASVGLNGSEKKA